MARFSVAVVCVMYVVCMTQTNSSGVWEDKMWRRPRKGCLEDRNPHYGRPTTLPRYSNHVANRNKHFVCLTQLLSVYFRNGNDFSMSLSLYFSPPQKINCTAQCPQ